MAIYISQIIRSGFVAAMTILLFIPMLLNHTEGADFPSYFMWAKAFNQGNIFFLEGDILSPLGVPLSQWSFGPGLVFSLGSLFNNINPDDAVIVGWLFAVIFWISYTAILLHATNNNHSLTLLGACITFIGTPIGYYSSSYASESLSYACLSVMIYWVISRNKFGIFDYLTVGIWASLLIAVRSQLALYLIPVYLVILFRIWHEATSDNNVPIFRSVLGATAFHVPLLIAVFAVTTVNFWMTGSFFSSVYNFGAGDFKSVDFLHPELMAVLAHPWHGLFAYHPLYMLGFVSLAIMIRKRKNRSQQSVLMVTAIVIVLHVYLHASWYVWWLGLYSFGMRGLSICAIILVPILVNRLSENEEQGKSNNALLFVILISNFWSFALLTQGPTQYYTYPQLFSGIVSAIENLISLQFIILPACVLGIGSLIALIYGKFRSSVSFKNIVIAVLLLLVIQYQYTQLLYVKIGMLTISVLSLVMMLAIMIWYHVVIDEYNKYSNALRRIFQVISVFLYITMVAIFTNLSIATYKIIAAEAQPPRTFTHIGTVDIDEVIFSYKEYMEVPGFDDKKGRLLHYIDSLFPNNNHVPEQKQ